MFHVPTFLSDETNILQSTHRRISTKINLIQKNCHNRQKNCRNRLNGTNERTS